jgi:hypothetical protein
MTLSIGPGEEYGDLPHLFARHPHKRDTEMPIAVVAETAVVRDFQVPLWRLSLFLMKCVVASVPALLLLAVMLYGLGHLLDAAFPELFRANILILPEPRS